ncbi:hypothetical protein [Marinimicrobium locisalis]|uniref:hypothetical protein n=1 Tax=Marinimicrobium locisalis TaxID=546022 RepID=UPI003221537A
MYSRYLLVVIAALFSSACTSSESTSQFDGLCKVYEDALQKDVSTTEKWGLIINQIETAFPEFYQQNYVYIMDMDPNQRYDVYKRLEEEVEGSGDWECPAMRAFFSELESSK